MLPFWSNATFGQEMCRGRQAGFFVEISLKRGPLRHLSCHLKKPDMPRQLIGVSAPLNKRGDTCAPPQPLTCPGQLEWPGGYAKELLVYMVFLANPESNNPALSSIMPASPIKPRLLAVFGRDATSTGAGATATGSATGAGGASIT